MFDPSNLLCGRSVMYLNLSHCKTQVKLKDSTMPLKVADCIANRQDPDLIWFYTVCPETLNHNSIIFYLFHSFLTVSAVMLKN